MGLKYMRDKEIEIAKRAFLISLLALSLLIYKGCSL